MLSREGNGLVFSDCVSNFGSETDHNISVFSIFENLFFDIMRVH